MLQEGAVLGMQSQVHPVPLFESSTWAPRRLGTGLICVTAASLVPDKCPPRFLNDWKNTVWGGRLANKRLTTASWAQLGGPARGMKPFHWIPLSIDLHTTTSYQKSVKSPYFLLGTEDQDVGTGRQHPLLPENMSWWCQDVNTELCGVLPATGLCPKAGVHAELPRKAWLCSDETDLGEDCAGKHRYRSFVHCVSQENKQLRA